MVSKIYRVLMAKPGLDGHDRGAKIVAKAFRDAGFEVIYTGLRTSPEQIVATALQEDVDVIGLSILSGAHKRLCERILLLLKEKNMSQVPVFLGGIIPHDDIPALKEMGIKDVFGPGTPVTLICNTITNILTKAEDLKDHIG